LAGTFFIRTGIFCVIYQCVRANAKKYRELAVTLLFKISTVQIIPTISPFDAVDIVKQNMKQVKIVSLYRENTFRFEDR